MSPTSTTTTAEVAAAAAAVAPLVPAPHPLVPQDGPATAAPGAVVHAATFTGTRSGEVLLALDAGLVQALTAGSAGLDLVDVVRPALEAATSVLGPSVLGPVREVPADQLAAGSVTALAGDGVALAWVGLSLREGSVPPVPRQASPASAEAALSGLGLNLLRDVEMTLSVEVGRARMTVRDLLELAPGSVVELDRAAGAPADLLVNGRVIARGEVVVVDEDFGLRITELVPPTSNA